MENDLIALAKSYLPPNQVERVFKACEFSIKAHRGQQRISGEPYIHHPLEVARILAEMRVDYKTLIAAILHDVIEDTKTAKEEISKTFGKNVAAIVDGVSKITQIHVDSVVEEQALNFQKMLMAMSHDIRVIVVKLADRLHNMRTLDSLHHKKRMRISRETLDIYVPIAQRLGLDNIRIELEDLSFMNMYPMRYRVIADNVRKARGHRKEVIELIRKALRRRMRQEKVIAEISGREKPLYSIYQKMLRNRLTFHDVYDVYAFRILVKDVANCYRALGVVHNLYKPKPGKFKDYIAIPKSNGYQSLHTILFSPFGVHIEVQIRTEKMNHVAESGLAAHWLYKINSKDGEKNFIWNQEHRKVREWTRQILDMQETTGNLQEFFEDIKADFFSDAVYVFTPKGEIISLPQGATAIDFAYNIHTDVGNTCTGSRINGYLSPLGTKLESGQSVEIITAENAYPNPGWLKFAVTAKARAGIRHYLRNMKIDEAAVLGLRLINKELDLYGLRYDKIDKAELQAVLDEYNLADEQVLLKEIGLGNRIAPLLARRLTAKVDVETSAIGNKNNAVIPLSIQGTEGMVVHFPKCCYPIPGDPIMGFISAGHGLVVHQQSCKNFSEYKRHPEKWVDIQWEKNISGVFVARINFYTINQTGVLAAVAAKIAEQGANILHVDIQDKDSRNTLLVFEIEVQDRLHLAKIMRSIRRTKHISQISR